MEERKKENRWIGIDGGMRTFEVKVIDGANKVTGFNGRTRPNRHRQTSCPTPKE